MRKHLLLACSLVAVLALTLHAQLPDAAQIKQERAQAELEVPRLVEVLGLTPGMTVADVGAGGGAVTVVLGKSLTAGRIFATDIGQRQLKEIRDYADKEALKNVTVLEGAAAATNLPAGCCDAVFMRDVYHHITAVEAFNKSVMASLKPGGRFAVLDFAPMPNSAVPAGVPPNRGGHGIPSSVVVDELKAAGFTYIKTIDKWPPEDKKAGLFLVLFQRN